MRLYTIDIIVFLLLNSVDPISPSGFATIDQLNHDLAFVEKWAARAYEDKAMNYHTHEDIQSMA